ncbi:MAG TPA: PspC domain-containing protein [Bacteroidetes bacterium]|nr:PspC domain-containing protein [Bacteroidota bacterium]
MTQGKKLYRTVNDKVIAGVAGGLAEYFDVDVVIFRLLFVLLVLFGGGGLLAYIVMWIVIPPKPVSFRYTANPGPANEGNSPGASNGQASTAPEAPPPASKKSGPSNTSLIAGIILIVMGVLFLIARLMPWVDLGNFWPVLLIIGGFLIIDPNILKSKNRQQ